MRRRGMNGDVKEVRERVNEARGEAGGSSGKAEVRQEETEVPRRLRVCV